MKGLIVPDWTREYVAWDRLVDVMALMTQHNQRGHRFDFAGPVWEATWARRTGAPTDPLYDIHIRRPRFGFPNERLSDYRRCECSECLVALLELDQTLSDGTV